MEMLTSAPSLCSAQMKSLHFDCKFPLSWGWMHRQIKLSMYFSEVWLTVRQSEQGRQPVCYQRSSSSRALHCAHSHPPPATQDQRTRAAMQSNTKAPFHPPFSFSFYKSVALSVSGALNGPESCTGYTIQVEEGKNGGPGGKCLHQFLNLSGLIQQSCHLWGDFCWIIQTGGVSVWRQPPTHGTHRSFHLLSDAETQRLESTQPDELFSNPHKGSF